MEGCWYLLLFNYKVLVPSLHMDSVTLVHVEYILHTTCSVHMHFNCIVIYEKYMCTNPQKRSLRRQFKQKILESQYCDEKKNLTSQNRMGYY